ncbi:MAG: cyclic nucleotide-binding domain-containing protein, partial [Synechococcaceae bacterium WB9_4xB_025]|nr:cyclic nucleotide-binding domain-containing protein [Synechococcaceae bacterium WB9_4xB_025]
MTQAPVGQLLRLDVIRCLSKPAQERVLQDISVLSFELGQQLVEPGIIPGRVLILLEGRARLVGNHQGRLLSLGKFEAGAVLGAASLLNGRGLENLIASDSLTAAAISDELWAELYAEEDSFRRWCDSQLWASETAALMIDLQADSVRGGAADLNLIEQAIGSARRVPVNADSVAEAVNSGRQVFLTSAWNGTTPGVPISSEALPPQSSPFPPRLISLPAGLLEAMQAAPASTDPSAPEAADSASTDAAFGNGVTP